MEKKEYEMPEEYKQNLAHLTDFIETRDATELLAVRLSKANQDCHACR